MSSLCFRRHMEIAAYSLCKGQKRKGGQSSKARKSSNVMWQLAGSCSVAAVINQHYSTLPASTVELSVHVLLCVWLTWLYSLIRFDTPYNHMNLQIFYRTTLYQAYSKSFPTILTIYNFHSHHETQKSRDLRGAKRATCWVRPVREVKHGCESQNKSRCLHRAITWTVDLISVCSDVLRIVSMSCNVADQQIKINTTLAKNKRAYHTDLSKPVL